MNDPNLHYVDKHVDDQDIQYQYGIVLGANCSGGELTCWNSDGSQQTVDYQYKVLKMDGRLPHEVAPFRVKSGGRRYCVIFFKLYDRMMTESAPIFEPARTI